MVWKLLTLAGGGQYTWREAHYRCKVVVIVSAVLEHSGELCYYHTTSNNADLSV